MEDAACREIDRDHRSRPLVRGELIHQREPMVARVVRERLGVAEAKVGATPAVAIVHALLFPGTHDRSRASAAYGAGVAAPRTAQGATEGEGVEPAVRLVIDAVIVSVRELVPRVLTIAGTRPRLPSGDFRPDVDRTLELAARRLVAEQTGLRVGYLEQLYTFGDRYRDRAETQGGPRLVSVGYLALVGADAAAGALERVTWADWYRFFPWEDARRSAPVRADVMARVAQQVAARDDADAYQRARIAFGLDGTTWNNEAVLERYELLYGLGGVPEAPEGTGRFGEPMDMDHRRILATAIARIRGKITYRPIVFELMPPTFTLTDLQRTVEALAGMRFHTPNFRRLVEETRIVERTGERRPTMGRPAEAYRFRPDVVQERPDPGIAIR